MDIQFFVTTENDWGILYDMDSRTALTQPLSCWCLGPDDADEATLAQLPGCIEADMRLAAYAEMVQAGSPMLQRDAKYAREAFDDDYEMFLAYEGENLVKLYGQYRDSDFTGEGVFHAWLHNPNKTEHWRNEEE